MGDLSNPIFHNEAKARAYLEKLRWADGRFCPHCGEAERTSKAKAKNRPGLYVCLSCKRQFTVRVGTIFERSHIPLHKWAAGFYLMASSKKGMSAHQLHRTIGVTYKTAWFMWHRIREAMRSGTFAPMGGGGGTVESDETFIGQEPGYTGPRNVYHHKMKVLSLIDRETGQARSFVVDKLRSHDVVPILKGNIDRETRMVTDQAPWYKHLGKDFHSHESVDHSIDEYVRGDVTTNTVEGFFSIFKRGMKGVYQHCGKQHLHRYAAEFEFRYNHRAALKIDDTARANAILQGAEGKRLTYRRPDSVVA